MDRRTALKIGAAALAAPSALINSKLADPETVVLRSLLHTEIDYTRKVVRWGEIVLETNDDGVVISDHMEFREESLYDIINDESLLEEFCKRLEEVKRNSQFITDGGCQ